MYMENHRIGQQFGNYRLVRLLGQGGSAEVYLAEHLHLGTQAAVKLLHGKITEHVVQSFRTEAQTIARLSHPHILRLLDFGFEQTLPFLVMDYAPGGTLRDRYPSGSLLPTSLVLSFARQAAEALSYAHGKNLIHRDVKPENMLIDANGGLLISDFGIVALVHSTASMKTVDSTGTVHYMAPEQIQGKPRPASDQYSLAIVIYEWLCGKRPFSGDSPIEIAMKHLGETPPSLRTKGFMGSAEIEQVLLRALSKDPLQRFPDILAFTSALERAIQPGRGNVLTPPIQVQTLPPTQLAQPVLTPPSISQQQTPQKSARQLQGEGEVFYALEQYQEALIAFEQILQLEPGNSQAHSWKGAALHQLKRYEEALAARTQAINCGSTSKESRQGRGESLYQLKRYEEAIAAFDQAMQIDPNYAKSYAWKAGALYYLGRYADALIAVDRALQIDPQYAWAQSWKGSILSKLRRYDEALASHERAIKDGRTFKEEYREKGEVLYEMKRYEEAIAAFDQAIQIDPNYARAHAWKAGALYYLRRYTEALASADRALQIDPQYAWAHSWRGSILSQLERFEEALAARTQALKNGSTSKEDYTGKGEVLYELKRYDEALVALDQALQVDPRYALAHSWKGAALYQLGRYEEALAARTQAINYGSTSKESRQGKGEALYQLGRYDEAIAAFDQAIQIDPGYTNAYSWKAKAITQLKQKR